MEPSHHPEQEPQIDAALQTRGVYVEQAVRTPRYAMSTGHYHTCCELFYLKSGLCTYVMEGRSYHLSAGDLCVVPAGALHATRYEGLTPCTRLIVFFRPDALPQDFCARHPALLAMAAKSGKLILPPPLRAEVEGILPALLRENELPGRYSGELLLLGAMQLLLLLERGGIRQASPPAATAHTDAGDMEQALKYIALNYQQPLDLKTAAAQCSLCPTYFSRKFRLATGLTFKEYLNRVRLQQATRLLVNTSDPITQVALGCGFSSSNYFKDVFRKATGLSPRAYRRQAQASAIPRYPAQPGAGV
ncbi:MAG: AraC family transcriptional regulator [Gemmiger sp.]|nr:AraC family transcriptional regulator [Gemmiger sp.]